MKIVITEDQFKVLQESDMDFNKTKSLVTSMNEQGYSINDIKKFTGLGVDIIVLYLKDKKIVKDPGNCLEISTILYDYLWYTDFIKKEHRYDDGSKIFLDFDFMSGSLSYDFISNDGNRLFGYATLLWGGECGWPLDGDTFTLGKSFRLEDKITFDYGEHYGNIDFDKEHYDEFNKLETFEDIINFFNKYYFKLIKKPIEHLIGRYLNDL